MKNVYIILLSLCITILLSNMIYAANPEVTFYPSEDQLVKLGSSYSITLQVQDQDHDFEKVDFYEDGRLIESLTKESSKYCDALGCIKNYKLSKLTPGEYDYKAIATDLTSETHEVSILVKVEPNPVRILSFKINGVASGNMVTVNVNEPVLFFIQASSDDGIKSVDLGFGDNLCGTNPRICELSKTHSFTELGEFNYIASATSVFDETVDSKNIVVRVICPEDNPCCEPGQTEWLEIPKGVENGCDDNHQLIEYRCDQGILKSLYVGIDNDLDLVDVECGDCDDNNDFLFLDNSNTFCDCNDKTNIAQTKEISCEDMADNDCDGKIDCFDEDCFTNELNADNCKLNCQNGEIKCGSLCSNIMTDVKNCGGCGNFCEGLNSVVECLGGSCTMTGCKEGYESCNNKIIGCEVDIYNDESNCGGCYRTCGVGYVCLKGKCVSPNDMPDSCEEGDEVECVSPNGCVGKRVCELVSYSSCKCDPILNLISPLKKSYDDAKIDISFDSNFILSSCYFEHNSKNKQVLFKKDFVKKANSGVNSITINCGDYSAESVFVLASKNNAILKRDNLDIDFPDEKSAERLLSTYTDKSIISKIGNYEVTAISLKSKMDYYYDINEATIFDVSIKPERYMEKLDLIVKIPNCAASSISDVTFSDENYKILSQDSIMWSWSYVEDTINFDVFFDRRLSPKCMSEIVVIPIAEVVSKPIEFNNLLVIGPLIGVPIVIIIIVTLVKLFTGKKPETDNIRDIINIIKSRRTSGETDEEIIQELKQFGIHDELINDAFKKL